MESAEKLSVTVTAALARMIREKVEDGSYGSLSEVIRAALRALQRDEEEHAECIASIKARINRSVNESRHMIETEAVSREYQRDFDALTKGDPEFDSRE
jgi:antitoxin ParD1/3/4